MKRVYTAREMISLLEQNGWVRVRSTGSHFTFKNDAYKDIITLNVIRPNRMVCERLVKKYKLC